MENINIFILIKLSFGFLVALSIVDMHQNLQTGIENHSRHIIIC